MLTTPRSHLDIPRPVSMGLPFRRWRTDQRHAITRALPSTGPLCLQLPTGAGKSGVAMGIAKLDPRRTVILTATKGLQDQYGTDAPFLVDVRGMGNYPCHVANDPEGQYARFFRGRKDIIHCDEGPCRMDLPCDLKTSGCDYFDQQRTALSANAVITSYAYWLSSRRFGRGLGAAPRLICDEAHALPEQLMQACRIEIPAYDVRGRIPRTLAAWKIWATAQLETRDDTEQALVKKARHKDRLEGMARIDPDTWEFEQTDKGWAFEPVIPRLLLPHLCNEVNESVVFLSATVTPETLRLCGIDDCDFHAYDSDFPIGNRPIYLLRTRRVDHRMGEEDLDFWIHRIDQIQRDRQHWKGIIHTVSYARAELLASRSRYRKNFVRTVEEFRLATPPAVLVSPSVTTGYDFPGDQARYQIIVKVPFPDTRSRITRARIAATPRYADHLTMQSLVQACGRPVRGPDDWAETFIIDDHARWFLRKARDFAPDWFWEAVERIDTLPRPLVPSFN